MEQGLTRRQASLIRLKEGAVGLLVVQMATAVAAGLTLLCFGLSDGNYGARGAQAVLEQAYHHAVALDTTPKAFPSREETVARLRADKSLRVLDGPYQDAYRALKHDGGNSGTVYVRSVSPTRLALVARVHHDAIEELDVTLPQPGVDSSSFKPLYTGQLKWSRYWWYLGGEALLLSLLGIGLSLPDAQAEINRRRRWDAVVNDSRLGPELPEGGYTLLLPCCEDDGDDLRMWIKRLTWYQHDGKWDWREETLSHYGYPHGLSLQRVPRAQGVAAVSSQWFDFCAQVAEVNAARWQQELDKREREAEAQRLHAERERLAEQNQLQAAKDESERKLAPVLTPATALMRQALDAQPLAPLTTPLTPADLEAPSLP
jgi:hypothetical protein